MEATRDGVAGLILRLGESSCVLDPADGRDYRLGCMPDCDLRLHNRAVSRAHATIVCGDDGFVFIDHSANGSYIQTEDRKVAFIRRAQVPLWGSGWIGLGEPLHPSTAIHFGHAS